METELSAKKILEEELQNPSGCRWCGAGNFPEKSHYPDCDLLKTLLDAVKAGLILQ